MSLVYAVTEVCGFHLGLKETPPVEDVFQWQYEDACIEIFFFSSIAEKYFRSEHCEQVKCMRFYILTQDFKFCIS